MDYPSTLQRYTGTTSHDLTDFDANLLPHKQRDTQVISYFHRLPVELVSPILTLATEYEEAYREASEGSPGVATDGLLFLFSAQSARIGEKSS